MGRPATFFRSLIGCAFIAAALLGAAPAVAQGVVCCNMLSDVKGKWIGAGRRCDMQGLSEGQRAMVCEKLSKAGVMCEAAQPYCGKCDKEAIAKARADYERLLKTYQEIRAAADDMGRRAQEVVKQGEKIFFDYFTGLGIQAASDILTKPVPPHVKGGARIYTSESAEDAIKEGVDLLKELSTKLRGGAWKRAAPVVDVIKLLMDLSFETAKVYTLLGEFDRYAKEANKSAEAALDALRKARAARERLDALEAQCRAAEKAAKPPAKRDSEEDDRFKSTGERELEAAIKLRDSWRRAGGMYEDTRGNLYDGDSALQEALAIVQKRSSGAVESPYLRVSFGREALMLAAAVDTAQEIKAGNLMSEGLSKIARGLEVYLYLRDEVDGIVKMGTGRSPGTKAAPPGR
jgi:hypothetical protein